MGLVFCTSMCIMSIMNIPNPVQCLEIRRMQKVVFIRVYSLDLHLEYSCSLLRCLHCWFCHRRRAIKANSEPPASASWIYDGWSCISISCGCSRHCVCLQDVSVFQYWIYFILTEYVVYNDSDAPINSNFARIK